MKVLSLSSVCFELKHTARITALAAICNIFTRKQRVCIRDFCSYSIFHAFHFALF